MPQNGLTRLLRNKQNISYMELHVDLMIGLHRNPWQNLLERSDHAADSRSPTLGTGASRETGGSAYHNVRGPGTVPALI